MKCILKSVQRKEGRGQSADALASYNLLPAFRTRQQKRKVDDDHSEEEGEGHDDFDPQQLREHEEFTKVNEGVVVESFYLTKP